MEVTKLSINALSATGASEKFAAADVSVSSGAETELSLPAIVPQGGIVEEQAALRLAVPMALTLPSAFSMAIDALATAFGPLTSVDLDANQLAADIDPHAGDISIGQGSETAVVAAEFAIPALPAALHLGQAATDEQTDVDYDTTIAQMGVGSADDLEFKIKINQSPISSFKIDWSTVADFDTQSVELASFATTGAFVDPNPEAADLADPALLEQMFTQIASDEATPEELKAMFAQLEAQSPSVPVVKSQLSADVDPQAIDLASPTTTAGQVAQLSADLNISANVHDVENWAVDLAVGEEFAAMLQQTAVDLDTDVKIGISPMFAADVASPEEFEAMIQATAADINTGEAADINGPISGASGAAKTKPVGQNHGSVDTENVDLNTFASGAATDQDPLAEDLLSKAPSKFEAVPAAEFDPSLAVDEFNPNDVVIHAATDINTDADLNGPEKPLTRTLSHKEIGLVHEQIADRLEVLAASKPRNGVTIHLEPRELGSLTVVVRNTGREVEAEVYASHDGVRAALEATRSDLAKILDHRGMNLSNIHISGADVDRNQLSNGGERGFQFAQAQAQQNGNQIRLGRYEMNGGSLSVDEIREFTRKSTGVDLWI